VDNWSRSRNLSRPPLHAERYSLRSLVLILLLSFGEHFSRSQGVGVSGKLQSSLVQTCSPLPRWGCARHGSRACTGGFRHNSGGCRMAMSLPLSKKGKGKMPAFSLPSAEIEILTRYVRSLNTTATGAAVDGDAEAGRAHLLQRRSMFHLSQGAWQRKLQRTRSFQNVASRLKPVELTQSLLDPSASINLRL